MELKLLTKFFNNQEEYIDFLTSKQRMAIANEEGTCIADLNKTTAKFWTYTLTWKDGKYISEFIKPFRASAENIKFFNRGCEILAEQLKVYVETNDPAQVRLVPNPFGPLNYQFNICPQPQVWENIYTLLLKEHKKDPYLPAPPKPLILDGLALFYR
jgi:hypothetical protein